MRVLVRSKFSEKEVSLTINEKLSSLMKDLSNFMYFDVVTNFLSGQALKVRSGTLRRSVRPFYKKRKNVYIAGVVFGVKYAKTHIGKKGTYTEIEPRVAKFLAIPTEHARTPAGVSRYKSPRDVPDTFVAKGVIFQKRGRNKIVPMFILKRRVRIPKRLDPREVIERAISYLRAKL